MRHKYKISKCRNQSRLNFADPSYANQTGLRGWIRNIIHTGCCLNGGSVQPPSRSFPMRNSSNLVPLPYPCGVRFFVEYKQTNFINLSII